MRFTLPVIFHTEQTNTLKDLDIDFSSDLYEVRNMIFYNLIAIAPQLEEGKDWTCLFVGGAELICPLPVGEVDRIIQEATKADKNDTNT